jgi:acetyltransferase-like isoleucine patch superfamily enzyme
MVNNYLIYLCAKLIGRIKNDPDYRIDDAIKGIDLLLLIQFRLSMIFRGFWWRIWIKKSIFPLFIGKGVIFQHPSHIRIGKAVTFEDGVYVNALSKQGVTLGNNINIGRNCIIETTGVITQVGEGLVIGNNSNLGDFCYVGASGGIIIGENVLIGQRVSFHSANHSFDQRDIPIKKQGFTQRGIKVEDDCWLGSGVIILDGVTIFRGAVIAAGTVVTKDVPEYSIFGGIPGRIISFRE